MSQTVFLAVLAAALMHAGWNALVKGREDRFGSISLLGVAQSLISVCCIPFVATPSGATWGFIILSGALHTGYKLFLIRAYQVGDLGQIYPLARGTAPLLAALGAFAFLAETPGAFVSAGIVILCSGIALMSLKGSGLARLDGRAVGYALFVSLFIAAYTLVDGAGARTAHDPSSYIVWMFVFDGLGITSTFAFVRGRKGFATMRREWRTGLFAGVLSLGSYWIVIWAMTKAPIAAVAALRETSVLFALGISVFLLKEKASPWRIGAAGMILAGVAVMRAG